MLLEGNLKSIQHLGIPTTDIAAAKAWYENILGAKVVHKPSVSTEQGDIQVAFLALDDLMVELYQPVGADALGEVASRSHGSIDHLAIDVLDVDEALREARAKSAKFDPSTPGEPAEIETFWDAGVRYVILVGPMGEKVELNQRLNLDPSRREENLGGWSHLGIPVTDLGKSRAFYRQFGFQSAMEAEVPNGEEPIEVVMMEKDGFVIELYQLVGEEREALRRRQDGHIDHVAMAVNDAEAAFQELNEADIEPLEDEPVFLPFWDQGVRYFGIRGPDGEKVEFTEKIG